MWRWIVSPQQIPGHEIGEWEITRVDNRYTAARAGKL
jgi:hypothetical protein